MNPPNSSLDESDANSRRAALESTAADWIARRNGGTLSESEADRLAAWLGADPRHAQAFAEMEAVWSTLNTPRRLGQSARVVADLRRRRAQRVRRRYTWASATLAAAAAVFLAVLPPQQSTVAGRSQTGTFAVRPDLRTLSDGSTVELNLGAEIKVDFSPERRAVQLLKGEALFAIVSDPRRPFFVHAGSVAVRAVGTAFSVRHDLEEVNVLVTEGKVAVERADDSPFEEVTLPALPAAVYLDAGRRAIVPTLELKSKPVRIREVSPAEVAAALAWREMRIEFEDTPFPTAMGVFNRHNRIQMVLGDESLARRRITGVFWADDPLGFVRLIEPGFGVKSERAGNVITLRSH